MNDSSNEDDENQDFDVDPPSIIEYCEGSLPLPPFVDSVNTLTKSDLMRNNWYGYLTMPKLDSFRFPYTEDSINRLGLTAKSEIVYSLEKYLANRAKIISIFKTRMESMIYDIYYRKEDAQNELDMCVKYLNEITHETENYINEVATNRQETASTTNLKMVKLDEESEKELCKKIFSGPINRRIIIKLETKILVKMNKSRSDIVRLIWQRRKALAKYGKGSQERPSWVPKEIPDNTLLMFCKGQLETIEVPESQPNPFQKN